MRRSNLRRLYSLTEIGKYRRTWMGAAYAASQCSYLCVSTFYECVLACWLPRPALPHREATNGPTVKEGNDRLIGRARTRVRPARRERCRIEEAPLSTILGVMPL